MFIIILLSILKSLEMRLTDIIILIQKEKRKSIDIY